MAAFHTAEYKIILLGEPGVGKTNYFFRLRDDVFVGSSVSTVSQGVEHMTFKATVDGEEVKVQVTKLYRVCMCVSVVYCSVSMASVACDDSVCTIIPL